MTEEEHRLATLRAMEETQAEWSRRYPPQPESHYVQLARQLLGSNIAFDYCIPAQALWDDKALEGIMGNLSERSDEALAAICGVSPTDWKGLNEQRRLARMEHTLAAKIPPGSTAAAPERRLSREEQALAVFFMHPEWSKKQIAARIGCNEKQLAPKLMQKLDAAIKGQRGDRPPKGRKTEAGEVEAWDD